MNYFIAIIYGIIEGITEWLPVSSTGHLILLENLFQFDIEKRKEFLEVFNVVIQFGAIMAVVILFFDKLWPFAGKKDGFIKKDTLQMWLKIVVACLPAAVIGILYGDYFDQLFYNSIGVSVALITVGILFILIETVYKKEAVILSIGEITYKTAIIIGIFQLVAAIFPGVSRSGATIIGALMFGVSRKTAAEFTFFLAVPVMFGASLLKIVTADISFTKEMILLFGTGMLSAFLLSLIIIKFLLGYIKKHDFKIFAYYRIVIGIVVLSLGVLGKLTV